MKVTEMAQLYASLVLAPGDLAVDATAGNGYDTLFLARQVGPAGRVYAFDIQKQSLERTAAILQQEKLSDRVLLIQVGHERISGYIQGPVSVIMFNLGYLPGSDHRIVTMTETTITAVRASLILLRKGGLVSLVAYQGHPEGEKELEALLEYCGKLKSTEYKVILVSQLNRMRKPPSLILIYKLDRHAPTRRGHHQKDENQMHPHPALSQRERGF